MKRNYIILFIFLSIGASSFPTFIHAANYSKDEIIKIAENLGKKKNLPEDKLTLLIEGLKKNLIKSWFTKLEKNRPVKGVFVYHAGEGGFIVKYMKGDGLISFKEGKQAATIHIDSWSAGALIGGSTVWGVGLVMGLKNISHFGGEYGGLVQSAIATDNSATNASVFGLTEEGEKSHDICLIFSGSGLSAGVGGGKLTITPDWD